MSQKTASSHFTYLSFVSNRLPSFCAREPSHQARVLALSGTIQKLALLDLSPIRSILQSYYCPIIRNPDTYEPVAMFRTCILMALVGHLSFRTWPTYVAGHPELAILSGFEPHQFPQKSALADFRRRLLDGPYQPPSVRRRRLSWRVSGRGAAFLRELSKEKLLLKQELINNKRIPSEKHTKQALRDAIEELRQPLGDDFVTRLNELLWLAAVLPTSKLMHQLGAKDLVLWGDSATLQTQAASNGLPSCECLEKGIKKCDCPRYYSDSEATWGHDSYLKQNYFGHRYHGLGTTFERTELPLYIQITPAHPSDVLTAFDLMTGYLKLRDELCHTPHPDSQVAPPFRYATFDKAYDAGPFYTLLDEAELTPIIPLRVKPKLDPTGIEYDQKGCPLCPADLPMKLHGVDHVRCHTRWHCPAKYLGRTKGALEWKVREGVCPREELCEPESKMGPLVYLPLGENHRLNVEVPRASDKFKQLLRQRSGSERLNSQLLYIGLRDRPYRRQYAYQIMAVAYAMSCHASMWAKVRWQGKKVKTLEELFGRLKEVTEEYKQGP